MVFVLDHQKRPCNPIHPAAARRLLTAKQAAVFRHAPFTIIRKEAVPAEPTPLRLKIDPGSKVTGVALVDEHTHRLVFTTEIHHRGQAIRDALLRRRALRRSRRSRKTRHRPCRFLNCRRPEGWLPPSLESRVANELTWLRRLRRLAPIGALSVESVKFDPQLLAQLPHVGSPEGKIGPICARNSACDRATPHQNAV